MQDLAAATWAGPISQRNGHFVDEHGRVLHLRGVNLSGNSKLPTSPAGSTHLGEGFFDHENVSFVGRPFPLDEADDHFARLRAWGLTFLRLLVTWESLEHAGPGKYDEEYIEYLEKILKVAAKYGIQCFIDPHQDTWSRFAGGSGAPGWTFAVAGLDIHNFMATGAAYVHQSAPPQDSGHTAWPTNYQKLAPSTMFTIFFGGKIFAPSATYQGEHPQEYLQRHFCNCFAHLARRLSKLAAVVGFEVINEPHFGYIGLKSLHAFDPLKELHFGPVPSALQSMALGAGIPQDIDVWVKSWPWPTRKDHTRTMNEGKVSAWLPGRECIWKAEGVWGLDEAGKPQALIPDYFTKNRSGASVSFYEDCYVPFIKRFTDAILAEDPTLLVFFEPIPNEDPPALSADHDNAQLVYSPHWYDLKVLFNKAFNSIVTHDVQGLSRGTKNILAATYFGGAGVKRNYRGQIRNIVGTGRSTYPAKALLFGECGLPMDINEKRAFETGDYSQHSVFLDAMISAMEESFASFTLWNYNPGNDNRWGDHWNGEDFSIYSAKATPEPSPPASPPPGSVAEGGGAAARGGGLRIDPARNAPPAEQTLVTSPPMTPASPFDLTDAHFENPGRDDGGGGGDGSDDGHGPGGHRHRGGRVLDAVVRPYASRIPGTPLSTSFDLGTLAFSLRFGTTAAAATANPGGGEPLSSIARTALIFIPRYHYPDLHSLDVIVTDGEWSYDRESQTLSWTYDPAYAGGDKKDDSGGVASWLGFVKKPQGRAAAAAQSSVEHEIIIRLKGTNPKGSWISTLFA
ncbi:hypothetical protein HDU86_007428 [Geranomyces michiganensis]|nr:hypothetical protein HDU86_007428 [Geranomyces michiganensis]